VELTLKLGSQEFKTLYATIRANGMAERALIQNERTGEVVNFYGSYDGTYEEPYDGDDGYGHDDDYRDDYDDFYIDQRDEECKVCSRVKTTIYEEHAVADPFSDTFDTSVIVLEKETAFECERKEEASLGRDRLVLSKFKGGVATNGDNSISVVLISGRMILMKHFVDTVLGQTFKVTIEGTTFFIDKTEGCPLGDGGELLTYAKPRDLQGVRSSKLKLGVPAAGLNGTEVILVRFDGDGPSEVSAGKWHNGNYNAFTQPGWCGSAVIAVPSKGPTIMVGVHRWGVDSGGLNGCEPFDENALQYFKRNPPHPNS